MPEVLLRMGHIGKSFGGTRALDDVSFDLAAGEVHVLAGENGAGKSTLIKILSGAYASFEGTISRGVHATSVIYQELSLVPPMSVLDNLFLAREGRSRTRAQALLHELALDLDVDRAVEEFPLATQQLIEIAKALARDARIVVMDEPTSALHETEAERLFVLIEKLKSRGCGIVYVTHRMEEIYRLADRITVLRDGRYVGTATPADLPRDRLISWMVGRDWSGRFPERAARPGAVRLSVKGCCIRSTRGQGKALVNDVMFSVRAGEVLGLAGLQGAGCSELLQGLFGALGSAVHAEKIELDGQPVHFRRPDEAVRAGVALLTNDRKATGILGGLSVKANLSIAALPKLSRRGWLDMRRERGAAAEQIERLGVRLDSMDQAVESLSGGNQQKVLLGRWLAIQPRVLLLDEPTRGIDVGAKHEIYDLMNRWTAEGMAIVLITSEMEELLALSDRIIVLHRGRMTAEFARGEATREKVLGAAMGDPAA